MGQRVYEAALQQLRAAKESSMTVAELEDMRGRARALVKALEARGAAIDVADVVGFALNEIAWEKTVQASRGPVHDLRDVFAGHAMAAIISNPVALSRVAEGRSDPEVAVAAAAYGAADAMLTFRGRV